MMERIAMLRADLRTALLAGVDTSTIRAAIADAEAAERAGARRLADLAAERAAAEAARVRQSANMLAAVASERIIATIAALEPPPALQARR